MLLPSSSSCLVALFYETAKLTDACPMSAASTGEDFVEIEVQVAEIWGYEKRCKEFD